MGEEERMRVSGVFMQDDTCEATDVADITRAIGRLNYRLFLPPFHFLFNFSFFLLFLFSCYFLKTLHKYF